MMNETIKYVGFYDSDAFSNENRNSFLPATNKMDYIAEALVAAGNKVLFLSPSWSKNEKGFYPGRTSKLSDGIFLTCGPTFGANNIIFRYLRILWSWLWIFVYLINNTSKNEKIIVYHSLMLIVPIILAKKIKRFELILEVEEIYQDVKNYSSLMKQLEYQMFEEASSYIFATELLNVKLNKKNKPSIYIYGTYRVEENRNITFNDDKIHVVYAGTFDPTKGGAQSAIQAGEYLSGDYHLHIIGFGSEEEREKIIDSVQKIAEKSQATITFDGLYKGEEYIRFIQKCNIGLSTQLPESSFNETSFPSKILSYMANGLKVVSVRLKVVEISKIGDLVYYYEEPTPREIAKAITLVTPDEKYDSRSIIGTLDREFIEELKLFLKEI